MNLLEKVKSEIGILDDDEALNKSISLKINAVKLFLKRAGATIESDENLDDEIVQCIAIGVNDLLNSKSGETKFSPAFELLARQLKLSR